ncbi:hypothetical protein RSOLAG1IB_09701 [Rhizoctonia solani AG-1 IB]|uniref:Uncharacterized protein n=1 Tax=Thanatephorus cucumeris (strain AG1-IB / isolate 7/3/14) TaxID=1108050 RepID=A0A0B7FUH4_THACB|nr:hypothetical protein RSOLAG1IB_09701 [Rhizoctonia solani AG-1 IB]
MKTCQNASRLCQPLSVPAQRQIAKPRASETSVSDSASTGIALIGECKQPGSRPTRRNTTHIPATPLLVSCSKPSNTFP